MRVTVGGLAMPKSAQRLNYGILRLGLPRIDHVINFGHIAKVRMIFLSVSSRDPALMSIGIAKEFPISKIASQQSKLPHVVSNILTDISNRAIRTHDDFLIFLGDLVIVAPAVTLAVADR